MTLTAMHSCEAILTGLLATCSLGLHTAVTAFADTYMSLREGTRRRNLVFEGAKFELTSSRGSSQRRCTSVSLDRGKLKKPTLAAFLVFVKLILYLVSAAGSAPASGRSSNSTKAIGALSP